MAEKAPSRGEIFVVDDDPAVRDTLSMVLGAGGYQVICFADGAALLAIARTRTPACMLLDVHIPGKSGLDILKELHGEDYPAPIFMISGQGDIAMAVSAIKNGALDFIEKPFRGSEIVARLDEAIEAYARRQAQNAPSRIATLHFPGREPLTRREREVLEQFTAFQVRPDQMVSDSVPQVETPFLKMTIEDGQRFGTPVAPVPSSAVLPTPSEVAAVSPRPIDPVRLPLPDHAENSAADGMAPESVALEQPAAHTSRAAKISPNGMGVPAAERVPASSGPPVPTFSPSLLSPPPARIPFKMSPPSSDLRKPAVAAPPVKPAAIAFSVDGPRVRLSLRSVLRGFLPFQLSGAIDDAPETAAIEIPFSIIEPQLSLGRIVVSPAQFQTALPEEYRSLLKIEEIELPIALPLEEVFRNLPHESLQLRGDQEEIEITEAFDTPFSKKAAEDAARMKVSTGPIAKPAGDVAGGVSGRDNGNLDLAATSEDVTLQEVPIPSIAPARTALQVAFDTDETLDAKSIVAYASRLPGVSACAIVFSDGLSLAGNIPTEYEADALCALAPSIVKRIDDQMMGASLGPLNGMTLYCAKTPVSFFAYGNICLAALHSADALAAEIRARLSCVVRELAQMYAQPA